jgi:hypothetical protein
MRGGGTEWLFRRRAEAPRGQEIGQITDEEQVNIAYDRAIGRVIIEEGGKLVAAGPSTTVVVRRISMPFIRSQSAKSTGSSPTE